MQVFVGDELQEFAPPLGGGEALAAELEHGPMVVLQAPITLLEKVKHEQIRVPGGVLLPHEAATGQAHLLHIPQPGGISRWISPPAHPAVGNGCHRKEVLPMGTHFDGTVDEGIEICSLPELWPHLGQAEKGIPSFRKQQLQPMGSPPGPFDLQGDPSQGKKTVLAVQVAGADRELSGLNGVADLDRIQLLKLEEPAGGCQSSGGQKMGALPDLKTLKGANVVPDQIGARRPAGEAQLQAPLGGHKAEFGVNQVLLGRPQIKA
jgi:hypothetical protein